MDRQRFLISALALITVWRMALLATVELSPDEALGVMYASRPDIWHLEMGPLTPWLIRFSMAVFGHTEFGVRFFAPILAFIASGCLWRLGRGVANPNVASWAIVVLQVIPAFNLAATTMTSSIVGMTAVVGAVLALRIALHRAHPRHISWFLAALCVLLAILADWRNSIAWCSIFAVLAVPERKRHHLRGVGFLAISGASAVGLGLFLLWNQMHGWPVWEAGEAEPQWAVVPNLFRWIILVSPVLLTMIIWALRRSLTLWRGLPWHGPLLAFTLPYAALDFGWGPMERWPHAGWPIWLAFAALIMAERTIGIVTADMGRKVMMRTGGFLLAGLFSLVVLRTDLMRSMGLPWPLAAVDQNVKTTWLRWLRSDPAGRMMGWQRGAATLDAVIRENRGQVDPWFILASDWQLAVATEFYLPQDAPLFQPEPDYPRIHAVQGVNRTSPHSLWRRYDSAVAGSEPFAGKDALYLTISSAEKVPEDVSRMFGRIEVLTIARIMHAGQEVRSVKIFACHGYHPPEF